MHDALGSIHPYTGCTVDVDALIVPCACVYTCMSVLETQLLVLNIMVIT
jgi:hypothetical protein